MSTTRWVRIGAGLGLALLLLVVARSLSILPAPGEERLRRIDGLRVQHLERLASALDGHWKDHGHLPATLDELPGPTVELVLTDPVSAEAYGYVVLSDRGYRLCARFSTASPEVQEAGVRGGWNHPAGEFCWELEVGERE